MGQSEAGACGEPRMARVRCVATHVLFIQAGEAGRGGRRNKRAVRFSSVRIARARAALTGERGAQNCIM